MLLPHPFYCLGAFVIQNIIVEISAAPASGNDVNTSASCGLPSLKLVDTPPIDRNQTGDDGSGDADFPDGDGSEDEKPSDTIPTSRIKRAASIWDSSFARAVEKGRKSWDALQKTLEFPPSKDREVPCDLWRRWDGLDSYTMSQYLPDTWDQILLRDNLMPGFNPQDVAWIPAYLGSPVPPPGSGIDTYRFVYDNDYSTKYKAIMARYNVGVTKSDDGRNQRAPNRWSDVTWAYWKVLNERTGSDPSALTYILRQQIINKETVKIVNNILGQDPEDTDPPDLPMFKDLQPGSEEFFAMVNSPNVIGTVYMLRDYVNSLKRKTIQSIRIAKLPRPPGKAVQWSNGTPITMRPMICLVIKFEPYQTGAVETA